MTDCIFCKFANGTEKTDVVFQDEEIFAFNDKFPKYPTHILIIPKKHIASVAEIGEQDDCLVGELLRVGAKIARERGLQEGGYRLLVNLGENAGQSVQHLHVHLLGGEPLRPI